MTIYRVHIVNLDIWKSITWIAKRGSQAQCRSVEVIPDKKNRIFGGYFFWIINWIMRLSRKNFYFFNLPLLTKIITFFSLKLVSLLSHSQNFNLFEKNNSFAKQSDACINDRCSRRISSAVYRYVLYCCEYSNEWVPHSVKQQHKKTKRRCIENLLTKLERERQR